MSDLPENGIIYSKEKNITPLKIPSIAEYSKVVGKEKIDKIKEISEELDGIRLLELNSTAYGGGVAEMLKSSVPFLNELGIHDDWRVMQGTTEFFAVTKSMHNLLQGKKQNFTKEMHDIYINCTKRNADANIIGENYDIITIHDPQPLGLASYLKKKNEKWLWRCHIDLDVEFFQKNENIRSLISNWAHYYDAAIFSNVQYIVPAWDFPKFITPPYIDPLSEKNRDLKEDFIDKTLEKRGINKENPIILQVSRFDKWKDPLGLVKIYKNVKQKEDCQLILVGSMASDDPEGIGVLEEVQKKANRDKDIHILTNLTDLEVNAFQRAATIISQNSIKEGFGLTVTEALWKAKPVVGRPVGGLTLQIVPGKNGFLIHNDDTRTETIIWLLRNPKKRENVGKEGKKYVREHFLMPGRVLDFLLSLKTIGNVPKESIISFHPWYEL